MIRRCREFWRIIRGLLGELSDEAVYARHLAAHQTTHSAGEWRRFQDARAKARFVRPRCC